MPKYGLISRIGQGAQGVLVKARVIETGATVAIKRVHLKTDVKSQIDVWREIFCLKNCNHENLRNHVFEDLKPENILVTINNKVKLGDFGLACLYVPKSKKTYSHQVFTRWYRAPELLFGSITYDPKVDIWACGCILAEYLNGSPLFMGFNDIDQIFKVFSILGTPNEATWPGWSTLPDAKKILFDDTSPNLDWSRIVPMASLPVNQMIQDLIRLNPESRLTARNCLQRLEQIRSTSEIFYRPPLTCSKSIEIAFNRDLDVEGIQNDLNELLV
ncbi:hypothetical protein FO519_005797 [Halicephalobus sp. NKZ332]|nr:hypothetical protein FO519_005797 [Halicephalobus sp. NKZ332]